MGKHFSLFLHLSMSVYRRHQLIIIFAEFAHSKHTPKCLKVRGYFAEKASASDGFAAEGSL